MSAVPGIDDTDTKTVAVARKGSVRARPTGESQLRPELEPRVANDPKLGDRVLTPTPLAIVEEVSRVPRGQVLTFSDLRARLAARFKADRTSMPSTSAFAAIVAGAVRDDIAHHRRPRCPIWRLVRDDGRLSSNWPLDSRYRAALLRDEGLRVTRDKLNWRVLAETPQASRSAAHI